MNRPAPTSSGALNASGPPSSDHTHNRGKEGTSGRVERDSRRDRTSGGPELKRKIILYLNASNRPNEVLLLPLDLEDAHSLLLFSFFFYKPMMLFRGFFQAATLQEGLFL